MIRAKLPCLDHFNFHEYQNFYEPSDDTFLLCDTLQYDYSAIVSIQPKICLEIGSGSGCVITFLNLMLQGSNLEPISYFATDINPNAALATKRTSISNNSYVEVICTDFVSGLKDHLLQAVDVLIFNPPYVPTPANEVGGNSISAAWAGGPDGRVVIDRFLPLIP
eukprot:gene11836-24816_t